MLDPHQTNWPDLERFVGVSLHHDTYPFISPTRANLSGRSVLITGASKGIGKATALSFAKAGFSMIAVAARSPLGTVEEEIKAAAAAANRPPPLVLTLDMDVTSEESVRAAAAAVRDSFGEKLDVLIANAGHLEPWKPVADADPLGWWKTQDVNLRGTFLCLHHFLPLVINSDIKTVITLSSAGAHNIAFGASAYQIAKFAVIRLTEFIDREYSEKGVVAVSVHPGSIMSELASNIPEWMREILIDKVELAADSLSWLCQQRREWISGRFLNLNWDMEALENKRGEIVAKDLLKFRLTL